jgi:metallo-beta-lactamase class B
MKNKQFIQFFLLILTLSYVKLAHADSASDTNKPFPPFHIIGNLYYVGTAYQADYLFVTPQGDILINSGFASDVPSIKANVEKLGFKWSDIKILLISHAHIDHAGGSALVKQETGAKYMVMDADVSTIESGGKTDFQYGNDPSMLYTPTQVDRVLHDGDEVKLGNVVLVAHLTPGHTKGCTTWTTTESENGKNYHVVIVGSPYVIPEYKLVGNTTYPNIAQDYEHTFQVLKSLPCDIFLGAHGSYFNLDQKYALLDKSKTNPFIDPKGYQDFIASQEQTFRKQLHAQEEKEQSK